VSVWTALLVLVVLLLLSAVFSGFELGVYSVSRARLDAEARAGHRTARLLRRLVLNDTGLLITLLVGNNLVLQLAAMLAEGRLAAVEALPVWTRELLITAVLSPVVFVFGELLPKDVFRRRPHRFLTTLAPLISLVRVLLLPISWPLEMLSKGLERALGVREQEFTRAIGREEVLEVLGEGTREGALAPQAEALARNVLVLRETPVREAMLPWERIETVDLDRPREVTERIRRSGYTRLPALRTDPDGVRRVAGYFYQLDLLGEVGEPDLQEELRPIVSLPPELPVDRALSRLRTAGRRIAVVGRPEAPLGLVTVMDLVARISGGLPG